jgi:hypothetical protein
MDIQVNKHQLERVVIKWLNKHYGNLKKKKSNLNSSIYEFSNENALAILMDYNTDNKILHVDVTVLVSLVDIFKLTSLEVKLIITKWAYETYDINAHEIYGANYDW